MMPDARWTRVAEKLPPEGVEVQTMSQGGMHSRLVREGPLWYFPDRSMYVYYTPVAWAPVDGGEGSHEEGDVK